MFDPVTQHVNGAALANLPLQPSQERAPSRTVLGQRQRVGSLRLRVPQERRELYQVDTVLPVVVVEVPTAPAHAAVARRRIRYSAIGRPMSAISRQLSLDQPLQSAL